MNLDEQVMSRVHHQMINDLIATGHCPTRSELAGRLEMSLAQIEKSFVDLAEIHGVVLHPHACEPWLVHPFSTTPTAHWIEGEDVSWWAPCIWCALGIATLVGGEVRIYSRLGAESEPLLIRTIQGQPVGLDEVWVHFAIPPARAWQNVHQHCSLVLAFRSQQDIHAWCNRHRLPHGEQVPLHQVARLAQLWYGTHADTNWHKWTIAEAQAIFNRSGLLSPFWDLGQKEGRY